MPSGWAWLNLRRQSPEESFQILIWPVWLPVAKWSLSLLNVQHCTAPSCIRNSPLAWYSRSCRSFCDSKSHASMKPSILPVMRLWPSGEKRMDSAEESLLRTSAPASFLGSFSSTSFRIAFLLPRNKSKGTPGGKRPCACWYFNACPNNESNLDGWTADTSHISDSAISCLLVSFELPNS